MNHPRCDKCEQEVHPRNNANILETIKQDCSPITILIYSSRHLLPTENCPGSPSRAQYLPGHPKDDRYPYNEKDEKLYREAYKKLIERYKNSE